MTLPTRPMIAALLAAVFCTQTARAQASPPPRPTQDVAPALLPPPAASPRPETVAPRTRAAVQGAQQATEAAVRATATPLRPASAPVDSVRPTKAAPQPVQVLEEPPRVDPPPPAPGTRPSAQKAVAPASAPDGPPPVGATARCKDGTYLFVPTNDQSCSERGGFAVTFTPRPAAPTPPRRP